MLFYLPTKGSKAKMRARGGRNDARGRRLLEPLNQHLGEREIGHVVEREGFFETFRSDAPRRKYRAGVVEERVDARLTAGDLRST